MQRFLVDVWVRGKHQGQRPVLAKNKGAAERHAQQRVMAEHGISSGHMVRAEVRSG